MKLRISYFNPTALKKDITRFAPAWAIYLAGCLLVLVNILSKYQPSAAFQDLEFTVALMAPVTMVYALLCAELLFGDLFNPKLCNALHAMPMKREGWFLTHGAAGLLFGFLPHLVLAFSFLPRLDWYWRYAFVWMLAVDLEYLFFFALAVFCAFCTGNRFAMALVYGLLNFGSMLTAWHFESLYIPRMYGVELDYEFFNRLSPVMELGGAGSSGDFFQYVEDAPALGGLSNEAGWYFLALSVLALVLLGLAMLLYRKRKLECAGDFLAVRWLKPVFHLIYTLTLGTVSYGFGELFFNEGQVIFLAVGLIIGWFTGSMLLQRQVRVFRPRSFVGLAAVLAVMFGCIWATDADPMGIQSWVPMAGQVESLVFFDPYSGYELVMDEAEELEQGLEIHRQFLEAGDEGSDYGTVFLTYHMKGGRIVERSYMLIADSPATAQMRKLMGNAEFLLGFEDWEEYLNGVEEITVDSGGEPITGADARELLTAVKQDCDEGTMIQNWAYHSGDYASVRLYISTKNVHGFGVHRDITVWSDAENTVNWLIENGYTEWIPMTETKYD